MTKLYDVMSAYPVLGDGPNLWSAFEVKLAMALLGKNRHYLMHNIQRRHFNTTAQKVAYGTSAEPVIEKILACTTAVVAEVRQSLPASFSQYVADSILGGVEQAAQALQQMPAN